MQRTILQTQVKLRRYITTHYQSASDVLFNSDDPYMSDDKYTGCFLAFTYWPTDEQKRLTYGMVQDTLRGVWEFLYMRGRFVTAELFIQEEGVGIVGYGSVSKGRPRSSVGVSTDA